MKHLILLFLVLLSVALAQGASHDHSHSAEEPGFAQREQEVMPFDLDATLHTFEKAARGGLQSVTARSPEDARNISLIREHLAEEAERFAQGDFSDPARIHGEDMPGLSTLQDAAASGTLEVSYAELPDGAELSFATDDETVLAALHAWFDAQVSDHGDHATEGD